MTARFAYLIAATFALVAVPLAVMSASPSTRAVGAVDILVDGSPQPQYAHAGRWYVEARKGREYAIRLRNPYPVRVAVALSVDGLNTIDARETTAAAARKWVIGPYETMVISGWQTSQTVARQFEFTTEDKSYGQALGKTANLGMISAVFFKERVVSYLQEPSKDQARRQPAPSTSAAERCRGGARRFASQRGIRRHWHGPPDRPRCRAGVARPRRFTIARGEHPLRIPSAARQSRRIEAGSDGRPACAA